MASLIQELKNRRVLPAVGVYAGGCWALIEVLDWLVEHYLLSPYFTEIAFWGLLSLIPAVVLIAWTHGRPGKDRHTTAEKVGVFINVVVTLGLLISVFGGKYLGAVASEITVTNEEGVQETHYIPSESFRRRMAMFFFVNESGDPGLDWLQFGLTELLTEKLRQNPFIFVTSPWQSEEFYWRMRQAGFEDGIGIPSSLMQEIADDANRQYFLSGSVNRTGEDYVVTVQVWETKSLKLVAQLVESSWDVFTTIEALVPEVREALNVPRGSGRIAENLPITETFGESTKAFKIYIEGRKAWLFDNDLEQANAFFNEALEEDPGFVLAWFRQVDLHLYLGDLASSQAAVKKAQELDYRLPARDREILKALSYRLFGQQDKLLAFLRMQVQLRGEAAPHEWLANILVTMGRLEEAREHYLAVLENDPLNLGIYLRLSLIERATGDLDSAIQYARLYEAEKPEEIKVHLLLGDFSRDKGELDIAQEAYLKASLLENQSVQPLMRMADISARKGYPNEARALLEEAEEVARTSMDRGLVRSAAMQLEYRLGRIRASIEQLYRQKEFLEQVASGLDVALDIYATMVDLYVFLGEIENAQAALDSGLELVEPPLDEFFAFSEAALLLELGDVEGAWQALARAEEIIDQFKLEYLRPQINMLQGYIHRTENDHVAAAEFFRLAIANVEPSVIGPDLRAILPDWFAELAKSLVMSENLDGANEALNKGLRLDPSHPVLWVIKARHQFASGLPQQALASVNKALTIWADADPEYREYVWARELEKEIQQSL